MLKRFFKKPTPQQIAARELAQTRLSILTAEANKEHSEATLMLLRCREERLSTYVGEKAAA